MTGEAATGARRQTKEAGRPTTAVGGARTLLSELAPVGRRLPLNRGPPEPRYGPWAGTLGLRFCCPLACPAVVWWCPGGQFSVWQTKRSSDGASVRRLPPPNPSRAAQSERSRGEAGLGGGGGGMKIDDPLDFEMGEDPLLTVRRPAKRKKVICLDDLLKDYCESGKDELKASAAKSNGRPKVYNSDDEDKQVMEKEIKFCKFVEACEEKAKEMDPADEVPQWGQQVFGCQKSPSILSDTGVENCQLLQSFCGDEQLGFDLEIEQGEGFLDGMLMDGWLLKLVLLYGSVQDSTASWVLTKLLYSPNKKLQDSASEFWDSLLSLNEADKPLVNFGYFPSYSILKGAVLNYGYLQDAPCTKTCTSETAVADTSDDGPPQNITAWLRVVSACCKIRKMHPVFSSSEAEDLLVIVISLFLDRQLEGLLLILEDCLNSLILYFNTSEWESSCLMVAELISKRVNMDLNCLRIVDCITGTNDRSKFLRSQLALQLLKNSFGLKVANVERILNSVSSINVKEKECNFFVLYVHLVLMDNLLFSSDAFRNKPAIIDAWRNVLRNCSTLIGCTDWRFYASKVRNKASYLLQGPMLKRPAAGSGSTISAE